MVVTIKTQTTYVNLLILPVTAIVTGFLSQINGFSDLAGKHFIAPILSRFLKPAHTERMMPGRIRSMPKLQPTTVPPRPTDTGN